MLYVHATPHWAVARLAAIPEKGDRVMDILQRMNRLKRPPILVRAAKEGALSYRRDTHLKRYFGEVPPMQSKDLLGRLLNLEDQSNDQRLAETADYSVTRHVDILIAVIGEAQIFRASQS